MTVDLITCPSETLVAPYKVEKTVEILWDPINITSYSIFGSLFLRAKCALACALALTDQTKFLFTLRTFKVKILKTPTN